MDMSSNRNTIFMIINNLGLCVRALYLYNFFQFQNCDKKYFIISIYAKYVTYTLILDV